METLEAIRTRRSIRKFKSEAVPGDAVRGLLEAAMSAPSAGDERPWQFVVIDDRGTLSDIPRVCPNAAMARQAALAILVCADMSLARYPEFWVQDCSAAVENMLIAARSLGLGAVWAGVYPMKDRVDGLRRLLGLPEEIIPFALIPLGYPDEDPGQRERYDGSRVHHNGW